MKMVMKMRMKMVMKMTLVTVMVSAIGDDKSPAVTGHSSVWQEHVCKCSMKVQGEPNFTGQKTWKA